MTGFGDKLDSLPIDVADPYNEKVLSQAFGVNLDNIGIQEVNKENTSRSFSIKKWVRLFIILVMSFFAVRSQQFDDFLYTRVSQGRLSRLGVKILAFALSIVVLHFIN